MRQACGAFVARAARAAACGPERARMAVFAAGIFQPLPSVAHEIAEAPTAVIQGRREEREIAGSQFAESHRRRLVAEFIEQVAEDVGACVIIGAVTFVEVGHIEDRVLKDSGAIAHAHDMI